MKLFRQLTTYFTLGVAVALPLLTSIPLRPAAETIPISNMLPTTAYVQEEFD